MNRRIYNKKWIKTGVNGGSSSLLLLLKVKAFSLPTT
jgi:hypothetical protein